MQYTFNFEGQVYVAEIRHFEELSEGEKLQYRVTENTFLIYLTGVAGKKVFELYIEAGDMTIRWKTQSDLYVDPAICEIIGQYIDNVSM